MNSNLSRSRRSHPSPALTDSPDVGSHPYAVVAAVTVVGLALTAVVNHRLARRAERHNPPTGRFIEVHGVRLHYVEWGEGKPLVLLHGNGSMIQDFASSGLIEMAAERYRVIAFDRPGYGHSGRPRGTTWTPEAQADLIHAALAQIGVSRATVVGHSWGALVAVALASKFPAFVSGLVLASGYYYPSMRSDVVVLSAPVIPLVGHVLRYTLSPILTRVMWPLLMRRLFGPATVPEKFDAFPKEMALRPSQLRASAAESALMIPAARWARTDLQMPVAIVAGEEDRLIDFDRQSAWLHDEIAHSVLHRVPGAGHMVHQTATAAVMAAIDEVAALDERDRRAEVVAFAA